jgi:tetratricopeptide (TPR) repeat protein
MWHWITDHFLRVWGQAPLAFILAGMIGALILWLAKRLSRNIKLFKLASEDERELALFRVCMWAVVVSTFGGLVTNTIRKKPLDFPVHYFLGLAIIAALLATFAPNLGAYAASRLRKLKLGGFEVELSEDVSLARQYLINEGFRPLGVVAEGVPAFEVESRDEAASDSPFSLQKLSGPERYQYEKLSHKLYFVFDQMKDPNQLDREARENFRRLILFVGGAALAMEHYTKSLDILLWLKRFSDRALEYDELRVLGGAYLWAAEEQSDNSERRRRQMQAIPLLKAAIEKNPYGVLPVFNLGWALLSLGKYEDGIEQMQKCIRLDRHYLPWANWNISCGLKETWQEGCGYWRAGRDSPRSMVVRHSSRRLV